MTPEDKAWEVVRRAFLERTPAPRRRPRARVVLAATAVAVAAVVVAALSPPGKAVFHSVREAVGIEHAQPALFSLPASGRLLVVSSDNGGVWLVKSNGFMRRLGPYTDAEWSPHGLYVIATEGNELVAFDPDGGVRWKLARHNPSWPRWEGTFTDTRIAYIASSGLRVVAGDGTDDHLVDAYAGDVPPAWDPARLHTVAYYSGGAIVLRRADGKIVWRTAIKVIPSDLEWSSDGRYLAVASPKQVVVIDRRGRVHRTISMLGAALRQAAFKPGTHELAVVVRSAGRSEIRMVDVDRPGHARLLFAGPGTFGDVAWSPAGDWLLVNWLDANQWVFIKGKHVRAVANIRQQFARADGIGPMLELSGRWCCAK
ncbi:MAG: YncE family protein [Gaiellaceae bacterium]